MKKLWVVQGYTTGCDGGGPSQILGVFDTEEQAKTEEEKEPNYRTLIDEVILNLPCKTEEKIKKKRERKRERKCNRNRKRNRKRNRMEKRIFDRVRVLLEEEMGKK